MSNYRRGITSLLSLTLIILASIFFESAPTVAASDLVVSTIGPSGITADSVTLIGLLNDLGSNTQVNVSFEYGKTIGYGNVTPSLNQTSEGLFSIPVSSLESSTTYHYRAKAVGTTTSYSPDATTTPTGPVGRH